MVATTTVVVVARWPSITTRYQRGCGSVVVWYLRAHVISVGMCHMRFWTVVNSVAVHRSRPVNAVRVAYILLNNIVCSSHIKAVRWVSDCGCKRDGIRRRDFHYNVKINYGLLAGCAYRTCGADSTRVRRWLGDAGSSVGYRRRVQCTGLIITRTPPPQTGNLGFYRSWDYNFVVVVVERIYRYYNLSYKSS